MYPRLVYVSIGRLFLLTVLVSEKIWDVPASSRTNLIEDIITEASCALLVFDLEDRSSFGTAKRWHQLLTSGET